MGRTAILVKGLKTLLVNQGLSNIVLGPFKKSDADIGISMTPYPLEDEMLTGTSLLGIQVVIRGTITDGSQPVLDNQDSVFDVLANIREIVIEGIPISVAWRQMSAPLAPDERGRPEIKDTYYFRSDRLGLAG